MKNLYAVIGANYGDEGKGLITNYLVQQLDNCVNIKFNGGAQAGHTVHLSNNKRQIFHQFGSGTIGKKTCPTYLTSDFMINPMTFRKEFNDIKTNFPDTQIVMFANDDCLITTPYDMLLNQLIEISRGDLRHGSCGMGINETVERSIDERYCIRLSDIKENSKRTATHIIEKIRAIISTYVSRRCIQLNCVNHITQSHMNILYSENLISDFIEDLQLVRSIIRSVDDKYIYDNFDNLIFEGAQGLKLDEINGHFPYVTRSRTGSTNITKKFLSKFEFDNVYMHYLTRSYVTRHGAGPLNNEFSDIQDLLTNILNDKTNINNVFQGALRFAKLDIVDYITSVNEDMREYVDIVQNLHIVPVMTCVDHYKKIIALNLIKNDAPAASLIKCCKNFIPMKYLKTYIISHGPTVEDVQMQSIIYA